MWALFLSPFPTTGSAVTAETRRHVFPSPTVSKCQSKTSACCLESQLSTQPLFGERSITLFALSCVTVYLSIYTSTHLYLYEYLYIYINTGQRVLTGPVSAFRNYFYSSFQLG